MSSKMPVHVMPQIQGMDPLEQIMRTIEAELETAGWDRPPSFWLVCDADEYGMWTVPFPVPDFVYMNPAEFLGPLVARLQVSPVPLGALTQGIKGLLRTCPGNTKVKALGLFFEAYSLRSNAPFTDEMVQHIEDHTVSLHPDRVEERDGLFVTVEGDFAMCSRQRGQFPEFNVLDPWDHRVTLKGRLPSALKGFLALMTLDLT